ncbi:hypothetical protein AMES_7583 [Amycolatopsis mediterranei S699]|uniref:DUF4352 domain-containing protein n=2 Tax=Amycolatopsis mediterranei TaxID=33910 RepID=A0A0H3DH07_AMYMU|nr:hypothetical protein [Amycolatopsis mediterranei]ADJ49408.1 hypothetical protein AMED_7700 [Amycolatopsis mediterranei U32]AEK46379.1 hypothetical protein RAM_39560 [Amycolatopsis mediterranei S699]AFO81116.1 hypothetical protein AMES_7583 [Amycolatopsis mediterranei S699]AGT88244.1 hypothetical protein B737_7583 [Amycolatopsis mediterranei RB]KDO09336.1 hypothetical protein DV26_18485 [Amycolatopsis mediterranei]
MALARTRKIMFTAGLLGLAVACGVPSAHDGTAALGVGGSPAGAGASASASPAGHDLKFGADHRFASGLTISVGSPQSFRPSPSAYPQSPRGAAFDVQLTNDGSTTYKLSGLNVTATSGGTAVKQVVDTTQGFTGITDAGKDVMPGRSVHITLAFAVPSEQTQLRLQIRPSATEAVAVTYCGPA